MKNGPPYSRVFPELCLFENQHVRDSVLLRVWRRTWNTPRYWALHVSMSLGLVAIFALPALANRLKLGGWVGMLSSLLAVLAVVFGSDYLYRQPIRRSLRVELNKMGVPICVHCGYDLRASPERCPECGRPAESWQEDAHAG